MFPYRLLEISLGFDKMKAHGNGIRKWGKWFDRFFRNHQLALCDQLLLEAKKRHARLCKSCRARIKIAEGELCQKKNNPDKARRCYKESLTLQRSLGQAEKAAHQADIIGHEAKMAYCKALLDVHKADMATCFHQLGKLNVEQGQYQSAERKYQRAVDLRRDIPSHEGLTSSLIGLGEVYRVLGRYQRAENCLEEALARAKEAVDYSNIADAQHHMGLVYVQRANFAEAHKWFQAGLEIARRRRDKVRIATSRYQLGVIAQAGGRYREALQHYDAAIAIAYKLDDTVGMASSYHQRGMIHHAKGD